MCISLQNILILTVILICFPQSGFCYIDPGTGSFVLQMIAAAFLGALVMIKIFWNKIKIFFLNLFGKKQNAGEKD